jgi:ribosomal-protein-alanine N-acetyltransferase
MLLRPLVEGDRAEYLRVLASSREHFAPWWPAIEPDRTPDERFDEQLARSSTEEAAGTGFRRVGVLDDGRIAALLGLGQIFRGAFLNAYCGWSVSVDCIGRGLATEAVRGILDAAFGDPPHGLGLHRVQANIIPTNIASLRVAEKCGFRREGLARAYLKIAGEWQDHVMFAKVAEEHEVRSELLGNARAVAP